MWAKEVDLKTLLAVSRLKIIKNLIPSAKNSFKSITYFFNEQMKGLLFFFFYSSSSDLLV